MVVASLFMLLGVVAIVGSVKVFRKGEWWNDFDGLALGSFVFVGSSAAESGGVVVAEVFLLTGAGQRWGESSWG